MTLLLEGPTADEISGIPAMSTAIPVRDLAARA